MTYLDRYSTRMIADSSSSSASRRRTRLAIYIRSVESSRGAERVAVNVARGLAERGHDVDFLVEEDGAWLTRDLEAQLSNFRVVNLRETEGGIADRLWRMRVLLNQLFSAPRSLFVHGDDCLRPVAKLLWSDQPPIRALHRYLRDRKPQAVLSFLNYPNVVLLMASALGHGQTRIIVSVRNHISTAAQNNESRWMRSVPRLMRRLFDKADMVIAPSKGVADDVCDITGMSPRQVPVIYNPVMRPELPVLAAEPVDHPWLANNDHTVLIAAGKMKPQKDFPTLIRAFAQVRAVRPAKLIILGEGAGMPALLALAQSLGVSDDIDFPGHVTNPFAYYRRASVFVLSSAWEGLPNVLIEAMACGAPVVSTDCPSGPREILENGRFGPLVPVGQPDDLAQAILATLSQPIPRAVLEEKASQFSLEAAVSQYEALMVG